MSSSTFNSKSASPWKAARDFACALGLVALLELALHAGQRRLFSSEVAGDFRSDSIYDCIQLAQQAPPPDIVVVGSSVSRAVNARWLESATDHKRGENLVLYSANARGTSRLLRDVVFRNGAPRRVIYVVSPRDWNARGNVAQINQRIPDLDLYAASSRAYTSQMFFQRHLFLFRYRDTLADWITHPRAFARQLLSGSAPSKAKKTKIAFKALEISSRSYADLSEIDAQCRRANAKLSVVTLPVDPSVCSTRFAAQQEAWKRDLDAFCVARRIGFCDLSTVVSQHRFFRNSHHLNPQGQKIATEFVRERLFAPKKAQASISQ